MGVSFILIAVGAILRWAVTADVSGVNVQTVGLILFIVGIAGLILSIVLWSSVGSWFPGRRVASRTVVREDPAVDPVVRRETVVRDDGPIDPLV